MLSPLCQALFHVTLIIQCSFRQQCTQTLLPQNTKFKYRFAMPPSRPPYQTHRRSKRPDKTKADQKSEQWGEHHVHVLIPAGQSFTHSVTHSNWNTGETDGHNAAGQTVWYPYTLSGLSCRTYDRHLVIMIWVHRGGADTSTYLVGLDGRFILLESRKKW